MRTFTLRLRPRRTRRGWALVALAAAAAAFPAGAAEPAPAGTRAAALAASVCAACHGPQGLSVGPAYPHLAGQRAPYLKAQLLAFQAGERKNELMQAIATQLQAEEIDALAAHFAGLPALQGRPEAAAAAKPPAAFLGTRVRLPERFEGAYTRYLVKNLGEGVVGLYYTNAVALQAAAAGRSLPDGSEIYLAVHAAQRGGDGKPLQDADGLYRPDKLLSVTAMARGAGWGEDFPPLLRNENWHYALFRADRSLRGEINQAECLDCHKPKAADSYLFLFDALKAAARR